MGKTLLRKFKLFFFCAAFLCLTIGKGQAQQSQGALKVGDKVQHYFKVPPRDGEFRNGALQGRASISCTMVLEKDAVRPSFRDHYLHCLRVGPFKIAATLERLQLEIIKLGGFPEEYIAAPKVMGVSPEGMRTLLFPITTAERGGQTHLLSYLVALVDRDDVVRTLQLTGKPNATTARMPFSSITLGTPRQKVIDILGHPSAVSDVPVIQGKLWDYSPFPFSVEMVQGRVYSIRLSMPDTSGQHGVFVPLQHVPE